MGDLPPGAVPLCRSARLVLAHVLAEQFPTIDSCGRAAGLRSRHTAWARVEQLQALGLVTKTDGRQGTLRPACRVVPLR